MLLIYDHDVYLTGKCSVEAVIDFTSFWPHDIVKGIIRYQNVCPSGPCTAFVDNEHELCDCCSKRLPATVTYPSREKSKTSDRRPVVLRCCTPCIEIT